MQKVGSKVTQPWGGRGEMHEYHDQTILSVDGVQIDTFQMSDISLGKSIYIKEQLEEYVFF